MLPAGGKIRSKKAGRRAEESLLAPPKHLEKKKKRLLREENSTGSTESSASPKPSSLPKGWSRLRCEKVSLKTLNQWTRRRKSRSR